MPDKSLTPDDPFDLLGVAPGATDGDIRTAFRQRAREWHPDVNPAPEATERFSALLAAYEALTDPAQRRREERRRERRAQGTAHVAPVVATIEIDYADAFHGCTTTVSYPGTVPCPGCEGQGEQGPRRTCAQCHGEGVRTVADRHDGQISMRRETCSSCGGSGTRGLSCVRCRGSGRQRRMSDESVEIPAGVRHGQRVRYQPSATSGRQRELIVDVRIRPHPTCRREGNDLVIAHTIDALTAMQGAECTIEALGEEFPLTLPAGTQAGDEFLLPHKGFPVPYGSGRGDARIVIWVHVPTSATVDPQRLRDLAADIEARSAEEAEERGA